MVTFRRNSLAAWLLATTLVAFAMAPLAYLSNVGLIVLIYLKFGLVIAATFLARFGGSRRAAWWFGFATFGWASILISVPSLWASVGYVEVPPGVAPANLAGTIGDQVAAAMSLRSGMEMVEDVVQFWFFILAGVFGGLIAIALERRGDRRPGLDGQADDSDPTNPL